MLPSDEKRLALLAACVRSAVVLLTTALDVTLPDYDTSKFITPETSKHLNLLKVSRLSAWPCGVGMQHMIANGTWGPFHSSGAAGQLSRISPAPLQGWLVWDSVFFADISARGYAFEHYYAFFPLLPALVSWAPTRLFAVLALAINAAASVVAPVLLYRLGKCVTGDRELAALACLFFILNPATIFHAAPYSEAGFTATTLAALYWLYCRGRLAPAVAAVAVSCGLRSNGVVNAGYLGHYCLRRAAAVWPSSKARALGHALLGPLAAGVAVLPTIAFQYAAYISFCLGSTATATADTGSKRPLHPELTVDNRWPRPWCSARSPYVYGFVQSEYWNVGFLRYWTWQQLPNFLLAAPVVLLSVSGLADYCTANCRHIMLRLGLTPLEPGAPPLGSNPRCNDKGGDDKEEFKADCAVVACGPSVAGLEPRKGKAAVAGSCDEPRSQAPGPDSTTGLRQRRLHQQGQEGQEVDSMGIFQGNGNDVDKGGGREGSQKGGRQEGVDGAAAGSGSGYLGLELAVFMYPWAFSLIVALVAMHVQVASRFLLSACPPLYWYMAHLWLGRRVHDGPGVTHSARRWHSCSHLSDGHGARSGHDCRGPSRADGDGGGGYEEAWELLQSPRCAGKRQESGFNVSRGVYEACKGGVGVREVPGQQGSSWCAVALWRWCWTYMAVGCVLFINFYPWT